MCSHVEGHMYQAMIFFLKVLQLFIIYESAKDRNLQASTKCIILQYFETNRVL